MTLASSASGKETLDVILSRFFGVKLDCDLRFLITLRIIKCEFVKHFLIVGMRIMTSKYIYKYILYKYTHI